MSGDPRSAANGPVTTVVTRHVEPAQHEAYEAWLRRLLAEAEKLDGYLGADIHPPAPSETQWTSVFRFETLAQLRSFERSDLNRRSQREAASIVSSHPVWNTHTGLETWFSPPPGTIVAQPVRWRMALLLGSVVYVLVLAFGAVAGALLGDWPFPVRLAVVIAVEIVLMTYVLLPWLTRRLAHWIYPAAASA